MGRNASGAGYRRVAENAAGLALLALGASCTIVLGINGDFHESATGGAASSSGSAMTGGAPSTASASQASSTGTGGTGTGGATSTGSTTGTGGTGATGTIAGTRIFYQILLDGSLSANTQPVDYSKPANVPTAYTLDASHKFDAGHAATGDANGNFTITGVPDGRYVITPPTRHKAWWLTNRNPLDLSQYQTSSVNPVTLTHDPQIHLVVNNMTAWENGDVLELIDPSTTDYAYDNGAGSPLMPNWVAGATHIDATGDWNQWIFGVTAAVQTADAVSMFHDGLRPNHSYYTLLDYATVSFSTPDMASPPFDVTANFAPFDNAAYQYQLNLNVPAFEATLAAGNPRGVYRTTGIDYQANPSPLDHGQLMGTADLAYENFMPGAGVQNNTYTFGSPFTNWPLFVSLAANYDISVQLPGTTADLLQGAFNSVFCELPPTDPYLKYDALNPVGPPDVPPGHPAADGISFFHGGTPMTLASDTPTITWDASATPHQYWYVQINPVTSPSCSYPWATCASFGGYNCGELPDGCGGVIQCGTCSGGQACGSGPSPMWNVCAAPTPACVPDANACQDSSITCGPAQDGCGNVVDCGTCPAGQTCGGAGTYGQCGAPYTQVQSVSGTVYSDDQSEGITIPPGFLQSGQTYLITLNAVSRATSVVYESTPAVQISIPYCTATAVGDIFTAP